MKLIRYMNIFRFYLTSILLILTSTCFSQKPINDSIRNKIKLMGKRDQEYRKLMLGPEKWKEFRAQPKPYQDSIWKFIKTADSSNFYEYISIIKDYGYINERKYQDMGYMILHFISHDEVKILEPLLFNEVISGRMPGFIYAQWYDRYLMQICKKKVLYGEYGQTNKFPCVDDLKATNKARLKIGLKHIKKSKCK